MGGWLLSGELNRELDNIFGAVGWAMNKVDPDGSVSGVYFPQNGKASTFPRVRLAGGGLWPAISGISVVWARVSGAGLCSLFSNFRFWGGETGSTVAGDRFGPDRGAGLTASVGSFV
jgi:hypothetical protein